MSELIRKYVIEKWWIPTITFFISLILSLVTIDIGIIPSILIAFAGLGFLFLGGVIQLFNKKWLVGILNLGLAFFTTLVAVILALSFLEMFGPDTDTFADNLKLPSNIKLEKPIDTEMGDNFNAKRPDSIAKISKKENDFQLYNSFQPGLYEYDLWLNSKQNGTIFLKAYEITHGTQLSHPDLKEGSSIKVHNTNGIVEKFSTKSDFTIYEGDWGKPYGARFEVWFKPENGQKEFKILQKNYIIEGWQR